MKSRKSVFKLLAFAICIFALIQSCKHEPIVLPEVAERTASDTNSSAGGSTVYTPIYGSSGDTIKDSVCFNEDILPIILSNCAKSGCHSGALNNYSQVVSLVSPGNPTKSTLYEVIASNEMPRNNPPLTQAQKDLIKKWITEGAKNNIDCGMNCDTNVYTFTDAINPVIQSYCVGCHNGGASGGGISLIGYANVQAQVSNGKLWGDINHLKGFNAMPLNGSMLDSCQIIPIKKWIAAGAPNN